MPGITWDNIGEKLYEVGVDHVVLYVTDEDNVYNNGEAWNGVTQITESPEGAEPSDQYADNIKYLSILSAEELNGNIEAYMYPDAWNACDGNKEAVKGVVVGQQTRRTFGLSYRTKIGNDTDGQDHGYKLHLLYGAKASPSERTYDTINDSPDPATFSWEYNTTPVPFKDGNPTSLVTIDSTKVDKTKLAALEDILYARSELATAARLPLPDEVMTILGGTVSETPSED